MEAADQEGLFAVAERRAWKGASRGWALCRSFEARIRLASKPLKPAPLVASWSSTTRSRCGSSWIACCARPATRPPVAADGPEAIEVAAKLGSFDVLVTDVMMPEMTGDELARRLRQTEPGVKVLYLTGFSDRLFKEKVTLWADEAFLDKPCSVKGLLQAGVAADVRQLRRAPANRSGVWTLDSPAHLAAARVHLEVRILPQQIPPARTRGGRRARGGLRRRDRRARASRRDQRAQFISRHALPERTAQIDALRRVEAQIPHAVGGQAAAIAGAAERLGRRRDDAERRAVRQARSDRPAPTSPPRRWARSRRSGARARRAFPAARRRGRATSAWRRRRPCIR